MPITRSVGKGRKQTREMEKSADNTESTDSSAATGTSDMKTAESTDTRTTGTSAATGTSTTETTVKPRVPPPIITGTAGPSTTNIQDLRPETRYSNIENVPTQPIGIMDPSSRKPGSTASRGKTLRVAKAKEEMLRIQVELAAAKIATLEAEDTDDDENEEMSVSSKEAQERVDTWLAHSQPPPAILAFNKEVLQREEHIEKQQVVPNQGVQDPQSSNQTTTNKKKTLLQAATQATPSDFAQLAAAITLAVKAGQGPKFTELPIFNGCHKEWLAFRSAYFETEKALSEVENINRLRRNLKGKAKEAVENLLISTASPEIIMKTLENRFGRPEAIATLELDTLRGLPRLGESPRDICIHSSKVTNAVSTLRALNCIFYLYNPEVARTIIEKWSPTLRYRYYEFAATQKKEEPDLIKIEKFLRREAELCGPFAQPEYINSGIENSQGRRLHKIHHTSERQSFMKCPVCYETGHTTGECVKFKRADESSRWDIAKKQRLCFRCLRYRNKTHSCKPRTCGIDNCRYYHNRMLHYVKPSERKEIQEQKETINSAWTSTKKKSYLKIIPVRVSGPAGAVDTFALLDDGSTVTLVDEDIAKEVGARGPIDPLKIEAINDMKSAESKSRRVSFTLCGTNSREERIQARTVKNLQVSMQEVSRERVQECEHLQDICTLIAYNQAKPKILIGQDNWHLLVTTKMRRGEKHQPVASLTPLGWVLHGSHTHTLGRKIDYVTHMTEGKTDNIEDLVKEYFEMDALLINPKKPTTDPEEQALRILESSTVQNEDGRYETSLLWKKEDINLPDNYDNSLKRLLNVEKKLDKNPQLEAKYTEQMEALVSKGYAEPAPIQKTPNRTWYLPHFAVINPMKPEKLRVVHDAAAKTKGVALNDMLHKGPDLLQSLPGVIMRFRQHKIAVTADIGEMFMQVKLREQDRDALRYLWRRNRRDAQPPEEYRMTSLIFGASSSPSTAIYVKNLNAKKNEIAYPEAAAAIVQKHYVDDYLDSFSSIEDAIRITTDVRNVHRKACFELKQWKSNSSRLLKELGEKKQTGQTELYKGEDSERVLGLIWKTDTDELTFNLNLARIPSSLLEGRTPSKRDALRIVMSLFDPLGFASPVTIAAKQILQEVWRRGIAWDDELDEDLAQQWASWMEHLRKLSGVVIPRAYMGYSDATTLQLHIFTDASESAYCAVVYWRAVSQNGEVDVTLIVAKARVSPLKVTSIPRLELQAAVLGTRMATAVIEEHERKPDSKMFWTDSKTVLAWIKTGSRSYRPYVAHRLAAIEEASTVSEWRWVPTKLNVGDDATRNVPTAFNKHHRWYKGPEFLREHESFWPQESSSDLKPEPTGEEKVHNMNSSKTTNRLQEGLPDVSRFSTWDRLRFTTARVLQFIQLCRKPTESVNYKRNKKNRQEDPDWRKSSKGKPPQAVTKSKLEIVHRKFAPVTAELLRAAEDLLMRSSQEDAFWDEIEKIKHSKPMSQDSRLNQLSVELKNETLRICSRIEATQDICQGMRSPVILDGNHHTVKLWITHVHRKLNHAGVEATINECRQQYWILRVRPTTRTLLRQCLYCRMKTQVPPYPKTGDLPACRLAHHQRPFTFTGVDYFGPLTVTVGRASQKRYVAIFTCLTSRAIHLEIAGSLTTSSAIMALRRMIARRGCPTQIWSDNGTNLKGADKELRQAIDEGTQEEAAKRSISWRFIPPGAPFMGGAWERMVRSVKTALGATLHERSPSEEVLMTLLTEVEYTVNSRPLTHVSVNIEDPEALTPNHFLIGGSGRVMNPGSFDDKDITTTNWRASQRLADIFWTRWVREYLPELQHRREPHGKGPAVQIGDLVQLIDTNLPRNVWIRGMVIATYPGPDKIVRTVDIRTKGGVLRRPVRKLVILPVKRSVDPAPVEDATSSHGGSNVQDGAS